MKVTHNPFNTACYCRNLLHYTSIEKKNYKYSFVSRLIIHLYCMVHSTPITSTFFSLKSMSMSIVEVSHTHTKWDILLKICSWYAHVQDLTIVCNSCVDSRPKRNVWDIIYNIINNNEKRKKNEIDCIFYTYKRLHYILSCRKKYKLTQNFFILLFKKMYNNHNIMKHKIYIMPNIILKCY